MNYKKDTLNKTNDKCKKCKHRGVYMCTNSEKCSNNSLFSNGIGGSEDGK